jgi:cytochrome c oxidase subunit II
MSFASQPRSVHNVFDTMMSRVERGRQRRRPTAMLPGTPGRPSRSPAPLRVGRALLLPLLLLASACGGSETFPMTWTEPQSDFAHSLWGLQQLLNYLGVGVGILVTVLLIYIVFRFRWRPGMGEPDQVHGNTRLELAWTVFPAVLLAVIAVPTVRIIFASQEDPPAEALVIDVIGHQWWWEFRYPLADGDTVITANEFHVPVGRPVHLRLMSADVIHNFWVPQMFGKRYNIPNRINGINFTAQQPGMFLGQCAEFCGESHALMKKRMIAHPEGGFERWLQNEAQPAAEPVDSALILGRTLTVQKCAACHIIRGTDAQFSRAGPDLTHFARRYTLAAGILDNNAANLAAWLRDPQALKPGALMPNLGLTEDEIAYMVAYLQTLY